MTIEDLKGMTEATITPIVAAKVLQCNPQFLRITAREHPEKLGFPVIPTGKKAVKIPRLALIKFLEGGAE